MAFMRTSTNCLSNLQLLMQLEELFGNKIGLIDQRKSNAEMTLGLYNCCYSSQCPWEQTWLGCYGNIIENTLTFQTFIFQLNIVDLRNLSRVFCCVHFRLFSPLQLTVLELLEKQKRYKLLLLWSQNIWQTIPIKFLIRS